MCVLITWHKHYQNYLKRQKSCTLSARQSHRWLRLGEQWGFSIANCRGDRSNQHSSGPSEPRPTQHSTAVIAQQRKRNLAVLSLRAAVEFPHAYLEQYHIFLVAGRAGSAFWTTNELMLSTPAGKNTVKVRAIMAQRNADLASSRWCRRLALIQTLKHVSCGSVQSVEWLITLEQCYVDAAYLCDYQMIFDVLVIY